MRMAIRLGDIVAGDTLVMDESDPVTVVDGPHDYGHGHAMRFRVETPTGEGWRYVSAYDRITRTVYQSGASYVSVVGTDAGRYGE